MKSPQVWQEKPKQKHLVAPKPTSCAWSDVTITVQLRDGGPIYIYWLEIRAAEYVEKNLNTLIILDISVCLHVAWKQLFGSSGQGDGFGNAHVGRATHAMILMWAGSRSLILNRVGSSSLFPAFLAE